MNCKQGDLAIVVRSYAGNEGKIVRCLRFVGSVPGYYLDHDHWLVDTVITSNLGYKDPYFPDKILRPIRDQPGEDEILRIAGRPVDQREPA